MESKKHILFISSWYPNRNKPTHGIFNRCFAEAAALHSRVSVLHVCSDESLLSDTELSWQEDGQITTLVVYYKKITSSLPLVSQWQKRKSVIAAFELGYEKLIEKAGRPDLIQLNVIMPAGIGVLHLAKKYGLPFVINEAWTGYCPEDGSYKGLLQRYMTQKIAAQAKAIMPVSEFLKQAMLSHGLNGYYVVVPNVVDIHVFVPQPKPESAITNYLHVSTLDDVQKNVSGTIRAFAAALKSEPRLQLTIVGDGPERNGLEQLAKELQVHEKIVFKGRLTTAEIVSEINRADAMVLFSNYETFSLAVAETFACGKPVIVSRAGGLTDLVTPDLGISIEKRHEDQLSEALVHFSKNKSHYDPAHIRQFVTDRFSKEKIAEQLNAVYEEILTVDKTMHTIKEKA